MASRDLNYSYVNSKGKLITGSAATLHHIYTECGGLQNYHDKIGKAYIQAFVKAHSDVINKEIMKTNRRKNLRVV